MNKLPPQTPEGAIASAINLEFVRNAAEASDGDGLKDVESFHRSLFLHQHGRDLERFRQLRLLSEGRLADLETRLAGSRQRLASEEPLLPVMNEGTPDLQPTAPWNFWDRTMFWLAGAGVFCLLVFGVFNISFNLLESGIVTFTDHPIRAYLWAALLPVGALAVKIGWDLLENGRRRDNYLWACLTIGLAAVLVWVAAYASVYPSLSMTTEERIANLSVRDRGDAATGFGASLTRGGVKRIDMIIVAAQAVAEICLSAVLGIYMTRLYSRHRPVRLARNPSFDQHDEDRGRLEVALTRERLALADAIGHESSLEHQLSAFVAFARSLYQKEAALRRDRGNQKRQLLDQISEQLKSRLADADRNGVPEQNGEHNRLALESKSVP
jgi:hypothetical protein